MIPQEDIKPVSYIKAHIAEALAHINNTRRPIFVTQSGLSKAVLVDVDSYVQLQKAVELMKLLNQSEKQISAGKVLSSKKVFEAIEAKLNG